MPKYRVTRAFNTRNYVFIDIEAADDDGAIKMINDDFNWDLAEPLPDSEDIPPAMDEIVMIDEMAAGRVDRVVADAITFDDSRPYSWDAVEFVHKVANMTRYRYENDESAETSPSADDAIETLNALIAMAREICGT